jgi:hypothetical protein
VGVHHQCQHPKARLPVRADRGATFRLARTGEVEPAARRSIISLGEPGDWDCGMILSASQAIDVSDAVSLY